jgi:hypothetical protein
MTDMKHLHDEEHGQLAQLLAADALDALNPGEREQLCIPPAPFRRQHQQKDRPRRRFRRARGQRRTALRQPAADRRAAVRIADSLVMDRPDN